MTWSPCRTCGAGREPACGQRLLEAATPAAALAVTEKVLVSFLAGSGPIRRSSPRPGRWPAGRRWARWPTRVWLLPRTLRLRFTAQVGLTPKRFARIQRLKRVARDLDGQAEVDWATVAFRHGNADQPHLAGEFRELAGVTPTGYLRSRVNGPNHVRFDART